MHLRYSLLSVLKNNVKNAVRVISYLFLMLVLLTSIAARDYYIEASDGEIYTITLGDGIDIDDFSIYKSDGEKLRGVTEEERTIAAELYSAAKLLHIVRTGYSPETPVFNWVDSVQVIGEDAFKKLKLRQFASSLGANSLSIIETLTIGGAATVIEISADVLSEINGAIANDLERRLLLDAYFFALTTAAQVQAHEQSLHNFWVSWETSSRVISTDQIDSARENFYKSGEYGLVTNDLINTYLGVPGFLERLNRFFQSLVPIASHLGTLESIIYSDHHLQELKELKVNNDTEIQQRVLKRIAEGRQTSRASLEQAGFFVPLIVEQIPALPEPSGVIDPIQLTQGGSETTVDVAQYFFSENNLTYVAVSNPSRIVTTSIHGSRLTIRPISAGRTTVIVTARDADNTNLTAIQTITVVVRQTGNIIDRPVNTDPIFNVPTGSNPRAEGLKLDVAVITKNLGLGKWVHTREQPIVTPFGEPTNIVEALGNGITGIIKRDPNFDNQYTHSDGKYTWWYIEWDVNNIKGWTIEADAKGEQILFRRPPDLEIRDFGVSDDEITPGQEFELEVDIRNNGPGESAATDVYFYYSENRHSDREELDAENDLRGDWKLRVPALREGRNTTFTLTVTAPTKPGRYYYGALLLSNIHSTDSTDHLDENAKENDFAREERVEVIGSPDYIVYPISVSDATLDPGETFTLSATVHNQGLGEPTSSPTLVYYRSSDALISRSDRRVGDDTVSKLDTGGTGNEDIRLTAPTAPGVYYYGACILKVTNEKNEKNNCSTAVAITVRSPSPVDENNAPIAVGTISDRRLKVGDSPIVIDVSGNFSDPDGDTLEYSADSDNTSIATARVIDSHQVTITPIAAGSATITVTASDETLTERRSFSVSVFPATVAEDSWMPDANLRAKVRATLGLDSEEKLTQQSLSNLKTLQAHDSEIHDLTGLEHAINLTYLVLVRNQINDITPLEKLTALTVLGLSNNQISDITSIENLTLLTRLLLSSNSISDITPLRNLTSLTQLLCYNNNIRDITSLRNMTKLEHIDFRKNQISDLSPLQNLTALSHLEFSDNQINDLSPLQNLTALWNIRLYANQIIDITPLKNLTSLTRLHLGNNQISDITPVESLTQLEWLSLRHNQISDISPLENLISLTRLFIRGNPISDYAPLGRLKVKNPDVSIDVDIGAAPVAPVAPAKTALLPNFPNPFNPETWIPYQLAKPADVTLTIYNMRGVVVRQLKLGHQPAGMYRNRSRAIHWDGRNMFGEKVATGVYFYTLTAGDFTATRKLLIRK